MNRPMCGEAGDPEERALLEARIRRQPGDLRLRNDAKLGGGSKGSIALGAETPNALSNPLSVDAVPDLVDGSCPIAVRHDARVGHPNPKRILSLLHVAGIDPGRGNPNPKLTGARSRFGHLSNDQ
jgi:hypothetical protein